MFSTMNTKCTGNCSMWLFLHVCVWFCSAPTKDFCLIPHLSRFLAILGPVRHSQGSGECFHMLNAYPALPSKDKNLDLKYLIKVLQYYSMMLLTWSKMKLSLLTRCKMRAAQDVSSGTINRLAIRMKNTHQKKNTIYEPFNMKFLQFNTC